MRRDPASGCCFVVLFYSINRHPLTAVTFRAITKTGLSIPETALPTPGLPVPEKLKAMMYGA